MVASLLAGFLTDALGRRKVTIMGFSMLNILVFIFLVIDWFTFLPFLLFFMGMFATFTATPLSTLVIEIDPKLRATISSIYGFFRFIGYALAPVAPYSIYVAYGFNGLIVLDIFLILFSLIAFAVVSKNYQAKRKSAEKGL